MSGYLRRFGSLLLAGVSGTSLGLRYSYCSQKSTSISSIIITCHDYLTHLFMNPPGNSADESLIGVYLTPKSIELLQNYLKKNGYNKHSTIPNGFIGNNCIATLLLT